MRTFFIKIFITFLQWRYKIILFFYYIVLLLALARLYTFLRVPMDSYWKNKTTTENSGLRIHMSGRDPAFLIAAHILEEKSVWSLHVQGKMRRKSGVICHGLGF